MPESLTVLGLAILLVAAAVLAVPGWRRRAARQTEFTPPAPVPDDIGETVIAVDALYVATTRAGDPYDRIAAAGLGFRARASVTVTRRGLVLGLAGSPVRWIPAAELRGADRATWTIDRVVEPDGLVLLAWTLAGHPVDSYLRAELPDELVTAVRSLARSDKEAA